MDTMKKKGGRPRVDARLAGKRVNWTLPAWVVVLMNKHKAEVRSVIMEWAAQKGGKP